MHELNVRNLLCPIPVIRTQNTVKTLASGDQLRVLATDPGVLNDIPAWCRINGHRVIDTGQQQGDVFVLLEVGDQEDDIFA